MTYNRWIMAARPGELVDYGDFQQPPSRLFRDYVAGVSTLRPFFDGTSWSPETLTAAANRTVAHPRQRDATSAALVVQQRTRGAERAAERAAELARPESAAIVTGQQACLFGGPLFVAYKALATLRVADELEAQTKRPVVPVFWVASDDHDFAEIRTVSVLDRTGQIRPLRYSPQHEPNGKPACEIRLDETIVGLLDDLEAMLPESPSRRDVLELLGSCYRQGVSLSEAFARLLAAIFPDLVVLEASDPALKRLLLPVLSRELMEDSPTSRLAGEAGQALAAAGYHQQVPVREGFFNLFWLRDGERRALALRDHVIEVRGTGTRLGVDDAIKALETDPAAFSPGALLRPLAQDHLLPTAAYVGGPSEIAYHAQVVPAYRHFEIPRPLLFPRPGLTLVEPGPARALEAEGLSLRDLETDPESLLSRWAQEAHPEVEAAFSRAQERLEAELQAVEEVLGGLDPTLRAAASGARGRALHQIETLQQKATRALKKRDQARADRLHRSHDALFPGGGPQERGLGQIGLLARHGLGALERIRAEMDTWARGHQILYL
jgi:bacillithiol biosynthesis cysteine-adding enzyme BshC